MRMPTIPQALKVAGAAFLGAFAANLRADVLEHPAALLTAAGAQAAIAGAILAGVGSVAFLYTTAPQHVALVQAAETGAIGPKAAALVAPSPVQS